jgi:hypothetical protein
MTRKALATGILLALAAPAGWLLARGGGAGVVIHLWGPGLEAYSTVEASGGFEFRGVPPGRWRLDLEPTAAAPESFGPVSAEAGATDVVVKVR